MRTRNLFAQFALFLVGLGLIATNDACTEAADDSSESQDAIIGGTAASDAEFLAVGSIAGEQPDGTFKHLCSGTLIAPNLVLTAQHCVRADHQRAETLMRSQPLTFNFGAKLAQAKRRVALTTAMVSVVDERGISRWGSDVGIYVLEEPIEDVRPMAVAKGAIPAAYVGEDLIAVGYGYSSFKDIDPPNGVRLKAKLRLKAVEGQPYAVEYGSKDDFVALHSGWNEQDLAHLMPQIEERYASKLLSGYEAYAGPLSPKGPCTQKGDSGGPLLRKEKGEWVVYGVVSASLPVTLPEEGKRCVGTVYATFGPSVQSMLDVMKNDPCAAESSNGRCEESTVVKCSAPNDPERRIVREACASGCTNDRLDIVCRP